MCERPTTGTLIEFEATPEILGALDGMGLVIAYSEQSAIAYIDMCLETDNLILEVIERLTDIRLAYIDHQQRQVDPTLLPLPQEEIA